jgi:hypothetical protein
LVGRNRSGDTAAQDLIRQWDEESKEVLRRVRKAVDEASERPITGPTTLTYDPSDHSLLILFRENRPAVTEQLNDDLLLRLDQETYELIGVEILDLAAYFGRHPDFLDLFVEQIKQARVVSPVPGETQEDVDARLVRHIRETLPV